MKVTIDIPDCYFEDFLKRCEEKSGISFEAARIFVKNTPYWNIENPKSDADDMLYRYVSGRVITELQDQIIKPVLDGLNKSAENK